MPAGIDKDKTFRGIQENAVPVRSAARSVTAGNEVPGGFRGSGNAG
jgi:hypothetical protein